jgi:hypothetical protein
MIIGSQFNNDPVWVQELQHDLYWSVVILPFELARKIYIEAEKTLGIDTELGQDCRDRHSIDHRVLQYFHDAIATKFRYEYRNDFEMHLPGILDGITEEDDIKKRWISYFKKQAESILVENHGLPRQIVIAATYPNPDERGKDAEDYICRICDNMNSFIKENEDRLLVEYFKMKKESENCH